MAALLFYLMFPPWTGTVAAVPLGILIDSPQGPIFEQPIHFKLLHSHDSCDNYICATNLCFFLSDSLKIYHLNAFSSGGFPMYWWHQRCIITQGVRRPMMEGLWAPDRPHEGVQSPIWRSTQICHVGKSMVACHHNLGSYLVIQHNIIYFWCRFHVKTC